MSDACLHGFHPGYVTGGKTYVIRPFVAADASALSLYFGEMSRRDRYERFLGAIEMPSAAELTKLAGSGHLKSLVAARGEGQIIGEARYSFDEERNAVEIALSVAESERSTGVGSAFISQIEQHAGRAGFATIFGDTLRTNTKMLALAKRRGFRFSHPPGDWTLTRFEKSVSDPIWTLPVLQGVIPIDNGAAGRL